MVAASLAAGCGGGSGGSTPATTNAQHSSGAGGGTGLVAQGKALYNSRGCSACHSLDGSQRSGPTWKGLAGSTVKLAGGTTVTANRRYLANSIEQPDQQIVAGYSKGIMSGSVAPGSIPADEVNALVAYIESLSRPRPSA
jgi:cytochrome c oxidase subunit 2